MFDLLRWWRNPEREVRQLNRDAPAVLESVVHGYPVPRVREIAGRTRAAIDEARAKAGGDAARTVAEAARYRTLNREARRRNDQVTLSSLTLAIIYLRAETHGAPCAPARAAIDEFLARWADGDGDA